MIRGGEQGYTTHASPLSDRSITNRRIRRVDLAFALSSSLRNMSLVRTNSWSDRRAKRIITMFDGIKVGCLSYVSILVHCVVWKDHAQEVSFMQ